MRFDLVFSYEVNSKKDAKELLDHLLASVHADIERYQAGKTGVPCEIIKALE